ncbi:hypothetical protein RNJ44_03802 [Nakaseomyces bracarensis]|uniref:Uncharacterized protein n=1 Tax=Nakaseomyces bracarensis TaxID=273131 RepID=A0ABR4NY02_9SACH
MVYKVRNETKKRPHSPDLYAIDRYKRTKLIEDLEKLSLNDSSQKIQVVDHKKAEKLNKGDETSTYGETQWVITQIMDQLRSDAMQVIVWFDRDELLYSKWLTWYRSKLWYQWEIPNNNDVDMIIDDTETDTDAIMEIDSV